MNETTPSSKFVYENIDLIDSKVLADIFDIEDEVSERQEIIVPWPSKSKFTIGAKEGDRIVGFANVSDKGSVNYVVHPDFQGKGIASTLLKNSISKA